MSQIAERFARDTEHHQMAKLHDDGLYRHIQFVRTVPNPDTGKPERSSFYWFEIVTWPGHLTITGDCGTYTFARVTDMFEFFRGGRINPGYWAEKVQGEMRLKRYSEDLFRQLVTEYIADDEEFRGPEQDWPGLNEAVQREIFGPNSQWNTEYEEGAREALNDFMFGATREAEGFRFADPWEWDLGDWDRQFLWCCHAIQWGISVYDGKPIDVATSAESTPEPIRATITIASARPVETVAASVLGEPS